MIVLEPAYDSYIPSIEMNGAKPVLVSLNEDFLPDFEKIKAAITEKQRLSLSIPHIILREKSGEKKILKKLYQIIKDTDIIVISDEVYDLITFDNAEFYSIFHHAELRNRSFAIFFHLGKCFISRVGKLGMFWLVKN